MPFISIFQNFWRFWKKGIIFLLLYLADTSQEPSLFQATPNAILMWVSLAVCDCQHGVCNHGITGNGSCTCYGGYTGPKCDQGIC